MAEKLILDANIFIQAKNREYRFVFAAAFWRWLQDAHAANLIWSTKKVLKEVNDGPKECPLRGWAGKLPKTFFLEDVKSPQVMAIYGDVIAWAYGRQDHYTQKALEEFANQDKADAFLIASAKAHGMRIITHENDPPETRWRVPIPVAAKALGVTTRSIFDVLSEHATDTFKFKK